MHLFVNGLFFSTLCLWESSIILHFAIAHQFLLLFSILLQEYTTTFLCIPLLVDKSLLSNCCLINNTDRNIFVDVFGKYIYIFLLDIHLGVILLALGLCMCSTSVVQYQAIFKMVVSVHTSTSSL